MEFFVYWTIGLICNLEICHLKKNLLVCWMWFYNFVNFYFLMEIGSFVFWILIFSNLQHLCPIFFQNPTNPYIFNISVFKRGMPITKYLLLFFEGANKTIFQAHWFKVLSWKNKKIHIAFSYEVFYHFIFYKVYKI